MRLWTECSFESNAQPPVGMRLEFLFDTYILRYSIVLRAIVTSTAFQNGAIRLWHVVRGFSVAPSEQERGQPVEFRGNELATSQ
jgi:hypothetical protein